MKAYIISFNRVTCLQQLCLQLVKRGCTPVIVDNSSTYPPLLKWLAVCPFEVHTVINTGSISPWLNNIVTGEFYIVTDHDLDLSGVPLDMVDYLMKGLEGKPEAVKCGLSLRIDDLPNNEYARHAKEYESRFWVGEKDGFYPAVLDTTLALYGAERLKGYEPTENPKRDKFFHALRAAEPYTARHLPWYNTIENLTDEEMYYMKSIANDGFWNYEFLRINNL